MAIDGMIALFALLIGLVVFCAVLFFVVKAAVAQGIKDALWNLEISMKNAVKNGVGEALAEREKKLSETEK